MTTFARRWRPTLSGTAIAVIAAAALLAGCTTPSEPLVTFPTGGPSPVETVRNELHGPLRIQGRDLVDADGRVVLIHGVNSVRKSPPFITPLTNGQLGPSDTEYFNEVGYNGVRLGVWPAALMPAPGVVDTAYLDQVAEAVESLEAAGIWVLLDLHQDSFTGMPSWATPADAVNLSEAPTPGFEVIGWAASYTSAKSLRQWDAWWNNEEIAPGLGVVDAYGVGVTALAERFKNTSNLIGLELINEPFPGSPVVSCVIGGCPELDALATARSTELTNSVRSVAPDMPVWWEAESLATMYSLPQMTTAGVTRGANGPGVGLSFHAYCWDTDGGSVAEAPTGALVWCNSNFNRAFDNAAALSDGWTAPRFLTEFGASFTPLNATVPARLADEQLVSWLHWTYPYGSNRLLPDEVEVHLVRTFAQATAGTPKFQRFDPATGRFTYRYVPDVAVTAPTVIAAPARHYPNGYVATVAGGRITSAPNSGRITVEADEGATEVTIEVRRA